MRAAVRHLQAVICDFLARCACRVVGGLFRPTVNGRENLPESGPMLLIANHLTYADGFLIGACVRRPVRFIVWGPYYEHKLLNWGFRIGRAIPLWMGHRSIRAAIGRARRALGRGEVVCIFAEGSISRSGELLPFQRGFESVARGLDVPIVPVHLWISPQARRAVISFGRPMPGESNAAEVREVIRTLAGKA